MKIKKGDLLQIRHARKGMFVAVALRDFETNEVDFFPLALAKGYVPGAGRD